jgi:hypothetical protein
MVTYTPTRLFSIRQRNISARRARRGGWRRGVHISTVRAVTRRAGRGTRSPEQRWDQHDRDDHIKEIQHHQHRTEPVRSGRKQQHKRGQCSQRSEHNQRHQRFRIGREVCVLTRRRRRQVSEPASEALLGAEGRSPSHTGSTTHAPEHVRRQRPVRLNCQRSRYRSPHHGRGADPAAVGWSGPGLVSRR